MTSEKVSLVTVACKFFLGGSSSLGLLYKRIAG